MATPMPFCAPGDIIVPTWAVPGGSPAVSTPLSGYGLANLTDRDPSNPLEIEETTVVLEGDLGSAKRIDGVAIIHHNFQEGTRVALRIDSSPIVGSPTDIAIVITVGAWLGRFAPHLYFDVATDTPTIADRTRRYMQIENLDANDVAVKIGEIVVAGTVRTLARGIRMQPVTSLTYGRSVVLAKKGPQYIHDQRTRDRVWSGALALDNTDKPVYAAWQDASYGVNPFLVWPLNSITDEPIYARFVEPSYVPTLTFTNLNETAFAIRELACGEAY